MVESNHQASNITANDLINDMRVLNLSEAPKVNAYEYIQAKRPVGTWPRDGSNVETLPLLFPGYVY